MTYSRRLEFTRSGAWMIVLALSLGLAAMNTGNNLIFLIFGLLLGFITVSGVFSEMVLRSAQPEIIFPAEIYASEEAFLRLQIHNTHARWPAVALTLEIEFAHSSLKHSVQAQTGFAWVAAQHQRAQKLSVIFPARGLWKIKTARVKTLFPFGFFLKTRLLDLPQTFLVYPQVTPFSLDETLAAQNPGDSAQNRAGSGEDFFALRQFRPGEDPRFIYWKKSARREDKIARENEAAQEPILWLDLPKNLPADKTEMILSRAAGFALQAMENGFSIGLCAEENILVEAGKTKATAAQILTALALYPAQIFIRTRPPHDPKPARVFLA